MKNEKGITLITLVVYVMLLTFVVAAVSAISSSFYKNIDDLDKTTDSAVDYAKFNMFFLNDIKSDGVSVRLNSAKTELILSHINKEGVAEDIVYSIKGDALYRNKVKIFDGIKEGSIEANSVNKTVTIHFKIKNYEKKTTYVIEP